MTSLIVCVCVWCGLFAHVCGVGARVCVCVCVCVECVPVIC